MDPYFDRQMRCKAALRHTGITAVSLADRLGLGKAYFGQVVKRGAPADKFAAIAAALNVSVSWLHDGTGTAPWDQDTIHGSTSTKAQEPQTSYSAADPLRLLQEELQAARVREQEAREREQQAGEREQQLRQENAELRAQNAKLVDQIANMAARSLSFRQPTPHPVEPHTDLLVPATPAHR